MRHIHVFEGWEQTEMDFSVKPEVIGEIVDKHIAGGSTVEKAAEEINQILNNDPELKGNNEVRMHLKRFHEHFFSPGRKEVDKKHPISLEDWRALIQGLSALPKSMAADLGSMVLSKAIEAMPTLKKDPSYLKEMKPFSDLLKSDLM